MLIRFASTTFIASILTATLAVGCTVTTSADDDDDASLTITNNESFAIDNIWIGPSDGTYSQSDDILGGDPLNPGDFIVVSVACDFYDVEILDETGTDCYVADYSLCGTDDSWDLDNDFFDTCDSSPRTTNHNSSVAKFVPTVNRGK